jgi:hypothetical protein
MELKEHANCLKASPEGIFVKIPPAHQGVADALRAVFTPICKDLPKDMADLLNQLR